MSQNVAPTLVIIFQVCPAYNRQGAITSYCVHQRLFINTTWDYRKGFHNFTILLIHSTTVNVLKLNHELF